LHQGLSPLQRSGMVKGANDWLVALGYPTVPGTRHSTILKDEEGLVAWHSHCQVHLNLA